jgi:aspartyl/asparaginyl-tRNA synthetase
LVESQGKGQSIEIQVEKIEILGECDPEIISNSTQKT